MILIFIFLIIGLIVAITICKIMNSDDEIFWTVVICLCVSIICAFSIDGMVQFYLETSMQETNRIEIYSIGNNVGVEGHFVLGGGYVESEMYYFYYDKGDYGYKINKLKAKDVEIVERDDEEFVGNIIIYEELLVKDNWWFAFGNKTFNNNSKVIIEVPKGTIQISYNIGL